MNYKKIKSELEHAIELRESGKLNKSGPIFNRVLKEVKQLVELDPSRGARSLYVEVNAELVIQYRLEGKLNEALDLGKKVYLFDEKYKVDSPFSALAVSNTLIDLGEFGSAIFYLDKIISRSKENSTRRGSARAHKAYCLLSIGDHKNVKKLIDEAIREIDDNTNKIPHLPVYQSFAFMTRARINNESGNKESALLDAQKALRLAKSGNYHFRIDQAEELIVNLEES